ncbi:MAG: hypothetical protein IJ289_06670 [Clostridia bacterium]|nr:hypothetical protein [Clostridia bacterium]
MKIKTVILIVIIAVVLLVVAGLIIFKDKIFLAYDKDGMIYEQPTETEQMGDE